MNNLYRPSPVSIVSTLLSLAACPAVVAVDLGVISIEVNQAVQYGTTKLFGGNVTWVRVKVGVLDSGGAAVSGVDASLRLTIDGVQQPLPPIFSLNGPISAPLSPNSANINDTVNFAVVVPVSNNVMFTVEVNPNRNVVETNYLNNTGSVTKVVECRKTMECTYVPINYTFNGAGLPPANLIEPGIGDGFLRGIYHPGEWNYHKSPLPPLTWTTDINGTSGALLNTLADIRNNQLPSAGQPKPDFIYGWLPGNPYSGNGQAGGIPSDRAFGNSDPTRHQRTLAHELGHCFGRQHNNVLSNTIGVDVEHHLKDTTNQPQIMPANRNDIMVAGLLTHQAWVAQITYDAVHIDARMQCGAPPPFVDEMPVLRVSGVIDNATRALTLDPVSRIASALPTSNDPNGDTIVIAYDAAGIELTRVTVSTDENREMCTDPVHGRPVLDPRSALYVLLPETIGGQAIHTIKIQDVATGQFTAERRRSANVPQTAIANVVGLEPKNGERQAELVRVEWSGVDADDQELTHTLLYSPDGGASWLPLVVNSTASSFEYDPADVPAADGNAIYRLVSTDGMNVTEADLEIESTSLGGLGGAFPETFLLTPNNAATFPQKSPIAFHATSWDKEDKLLSGASIVWTSNLDGQIGTGMLFVNSSLSPGFHTIQVTATDSGNNSTAKAIVINITPRVVISPDCNDNGILDSIDISNGTSVDLNGNGIPDECELLCGADINNSGDVNVNDLLAVIDAWGPCLGCPEDVDDSGDVNVNDLLAVLGQWGPCP